MNQRYHFIYYPYSSEGIGYISNKCICDNFYEIKEKFNLEGNI